MNFSQIENLLNQKWFIDRDPLFTSAAATALNIMLGNEDATKRSRCISLLNVYNENGKKINIEDDGIPENAVAVIKLTGVILRNGTWSYWGADEIVSLLNIVENNKNFIGAVLIVNSPGGAANAIPIFQKFFKNKTKPIVSLATQACSLAYWVPALTDYIIAEDDLTANFGSIGVMTYFADWEPFWAKYGVKFHNIKPDESFDKNEAVIQAKEGKYELIKKEHLSPLAIKFQTAVKENRPNLKATEENGVLSGKVFYYEQAKELGLCDGLGDLEDALQMVHVLSEINKN